MIVCISIYCYSYISDNLNPLNMVMRSKRNFVSEPHLQSPST